MIAVILCIAALFQAIALGCIVLVAARRFDRIKQRLTTIEPGDWTQEETDRIVKSINGSRHE